MVVTSLMGPAGQGITGSTFKGHDHEGEPMGKGVV